MYRLEFKGGSIKGQFTFKFHLFVLTSDKEELISYQAQKKGYLSRSNRVNGFSCAFPNVKVITTQEGFGLQKSYYNVFFRLDAEAEKIYTVRPLGLDKYPDFKKDFIFKARGRFLTHEEILETYGKDSQTVRFYVNQTYLSKGVLGQMVRYDFADGGGGLLSTTKVRVIR